MCSQGRQHDKQNDEALLRRAAASLDELDGYMRTNTYDEQDGEREVQEHARAVSRALKARLGSTDTGGLWNFQST